MKVVVYDQRTFGDKIDHFPYEMELFDALRKVAKDEEALVAWDRDVPQEEFLKLASDSKPFVGLYSNRNQWHAPWNDSNERISLIVFTTTGDGVSHILYGWNGERWRRITWNTGIPGGVKVEDLP